MTTLKPCPFCGSTPETAGNETVPVVVAWCPEIRCAASGNDVYVESWNTRADEARIRREALAEVRQAMHDDYLAWPAGQFPSGALAWAGGVIDSLEAKS